MCPQCDPYLAPMPMPEAAAYAAALDRARSAQRDGVFDVVEETIAGGHARHLFSCTQCAQLFILEVGGCHVLGDQWRPLHGN
jgi:hypothetical protein